MRKWTTIARVLSLLAVPLLAVRCRESVAPAQRSDRTPTQRPTQIPTLDVVADQNNGTFGASGTAILKGFNPTNPHLGDAIVATFFWLGSTNIITSVTDHLTDGTPVGNTYSPVEYVTAGGISMATYVATNVRNFPDPNPDQNKVLVVQAKLAASITDGGIMLSAYGGVQAAYAQAMGAHQSASGSGTAQTTADPGAIPVGAGALAYGVTLSNGVVGIDRPPGFTNVTTLSGASMKADGEYAVPAGVASVDPQWTWYFNSPSTWLATVLTLNPAVSGPGNRPPIAAFTPSCTGLTCTFNNSSSDPDGSIAGSQWTFGDGATSTAQSPAHSYAAAGTYTVTLTVTDNRGATNAVSHPVTVSPSNQPPTANFTFSCSGLTCGFTSTSSDPDGSIASYSWTFGDGATATAQNPSHTYAAGGSYTVTLRVTDNQGASSAPTPKTVTVTAPNQPPTASFTFSCSGLTCGFTTTSSDPDGSITAYSWTFGDGATSPAQNPSHTYAAGGTYTVTLRVTDNQGATNAISHGVTVTPPNLPPVVNAGPDETAVTGLLYSLKASFSDPNNDGPWSYTINWGDGSTTTGSASSQGTISAGHTYIVLLPRSFTVTVTVRDSHGASGSDTKVVTVLLL